MSDGTEHYFIITGGPGAGKSTLIDALRDAGFRTGEEAGRRIIKDQVAIGGRALPWIDPALFAEIMLSEDIRAHHEHLAAPGSVFFDRGVPDVIGYLRLVGLAVPPHMMKATALCRYNRRVFVCPPWPEIFRQDRERKQTIAEAERTYASLVGTYTELGYELVEVPKRPVNERVRFVLERRQASPATTRSRLPILRCQP
jgi:predicted ATPase